MSNFFWLQPKRYVEGESMPGFNNIALEWAVFRASTVASVFSAAPLVAREQETRAVTPFQTAEALYLARQLQIALGPQRIAATPKIFSDVAILVAAMQGQHHSVSIQLQSASEEMPAMAPKAGGAASAAIKLPSELETLLSLRERARACVREKKYEEAIALFEQVLARRQLLNEKRQAVTLAEIGVVCQAIGQVKKAEALLRESLQIRVYGTPLRQLILLLRNAGRNEEALTFGKQMQGWLLRVAQLDTERKQAARLARAHRKPEAIALWEKILSHEIQLYGEPNPTSIFHTAVVYYYMGNLERAETLLRQSLERNEKPDTLFHLALVFQSQDRHVEAIPLFERALVMSPGNTHFSHALSVSRNVERRAVLNRIHALTTTARGACEAGYFRKAIRVYRELVAEECAHNIPSPITFCELGIALREEKQFEAAEVVFRESLRFKKHPRALCELGILQSLTRRFAEAIASFKEAIQLEGEQYARSFYEMGETYFRWGVGHYEEALSAAERALVLEGERRSDSWELKSKILYKLGHFPEALKAIDKSLAIDPTDSFFYVRRSKILRQMERYEEALGSVNHARVLDRDKKFEKEILMEEGIALCGLEKYRESVDCLHRLISMERGCHGGTWSRLAMALFRWGQSRKALVAIDRALSLGKLRKEHLLLKLEIVKALSLREEIKRVTAQLTALDAKA